MQVLDGLTTFIAFTRGLLEANPYTIWLIRVIGNEYLGVGIEKIAYIILGLFILWIIRRFSRLRDRPLRVVGVGLFDTVLVFLALSVGQVVLTNFATIGV